jgi:sugar (pentulose or hexulose) kinase
MAHGRAEMARAVLEGVALNLRLILMSLGNLSRFTALRPLGGGARSAQPRMATSKGIAVVNL